MSQETHNGWDTIAVELSATLKSARARLRNGVLEIRVPKRWGLAARQQAVDALTIRMASHLARQAHLISLVTEQADQPRLTLTDPSALSTYVQSLNAKTFQAPLKAVRLGWAKHSRLAQLNRRTGVMTISRYCLVDVPQAALDYLIIHELAHFEQGNHSPAFWRLVSRFCPDYPRWRKVMAAHHFAAVAQDEGQTASTSP